MLALPISTRTMPIGATLQEQNVPCVHECFAHPTTVVLSGLKFKVKNTFIDEESLESESDRGDCRKQRRVQTCTGNFATLGTVKELEQSIDDPSLPAVPHAHTYAGELLLHDYAKHPSLARLSSFPFTIRNTFIEVKLSEPDNDADVNVHHPGVCTCKASFEKLSFRTSRADDTVSTNANDSDLSDIEGFENTPFDDSPFFDAEGRSFFPPPGSFATVGSSMSGTLRVTRPTLNLCSAISSATSASACSPTTKTCCHWKNKGFCKLGPNCKFAHPADKQGVGLTQRKKKSSSAAPLVIQLQALCRGVDSCSPPHPCENKSDKVCCHWKNKGWCKYQETCKFQHPAHKQGVGSTKRVRVLKMDS